MPSFRYSAIMTANTGVRVWRAQLMYSLLPVLLAALFGAHVAYADRIDDLVTRLSAAQGSWENGAFPSLDLPKTASTKEVLDKIFKMTSFGNERVTSYDILAVRLVRIPPITSEPFKRSTGGQSNTNKSNEADSWHNGFTAARLKTNVGELIVLIRYNGTVVGWWSRVFDLRHWPFGSD